MPHILVATDFSEVGENAVHYACKLAQDYKASLTVLHSFIIPVTFSDTPMPVMPVDEGRSIAEERMGQFVQTLQLKYPGLTIVSKIMFGDIVDCLEDYTTSERPWFIVLGNSVDDSTSLWLGSNVVSALQNLKTIVVAIPRDTEYKKPGKICFACDLVDTIEHLPAKNLISLIQGLGAQLHLLHVDVQQNGSQADRAFENTGLHQVLSELNPVYHYVNKEGVDEAIHEFVEENHMDWLLMMPHRHTFFEGLFHKSHTKALVKMSQIPIAALHEK